VAAEKAEIKKVANILSREVTTSNNTNPKVKIAIYPNPNPIKMPNLTVILGSQANNLNATMTLVRLSARAKAFWLVKIRKKCKRKKFSPKWRIYSSLFS
jgi:hypothetical protein